MPRCVPAFVCLSALVAGVIGIASPAGAQGLEAKQRQAAALESQLRDQGRRLSMAAEDYNEARVQRERIEAQADGARALVVAAEREWASLREQLGRRARLLYMHPGAALDAFFGARSIGDVARARVYGSEVLLADEALLSEAEKARHEVLARAKSLDGLRQQAERKEGELSARRAQVQRELGTQQSLLRGVRGDIAELIAAERARQEAAAAARAAQQQVAARPAAKGPAKAATVKPEEPAAKPPAVRASASKAVETARAQLGKPYEWGASGPGSFDCSGLTMYAWKSAGVSLPHSSRAQYASLPHVPRSQIQPGDLLFYGNPIHHVGIYEGGGMMINAPETGETVRRNSISRSDYAGAARP